MTKAIDLWRGFFTPAGKKVQKCNFDLRTLEKQYLHQRQLISSLKTSFRNFFCCRPQLSEQGCQIFLGRTCQNVKIIPNDHKINQIVMN
jgi:hypothetical protein